MKRRILLLISFVFISGTAIIWSCKKDDEKVATKDEAVAVTKSNLKADIIYDDLYMSTEDILIELELNKYPSSSLEKASSCKTIVVDKPNDNVNFPKTVTITYNNCITHGIEKSGSIIITQSSKLREAGAKRTVTLKNFVINDSIQVEGKLTVENLSEVKGKPILRVTLENGKVSFSGKTFLTRNFTRTITWTEGYASLLSLSDDKYAIYQKASGTTKEGFSYSTVTSDSLVFKLTDLCIKKGKLDMTVGAQKVYIDFNRTSCWDKIKIVIGPDVINTDLLLYSL